MMFVLQFLNIGPQRIIYNHHVNIVIRLVHAVALYKYLFHCLIDHHWCDHSYQNIQLG